jgi:hypothetical protein
MRGLRRLQNACCCFSPVFVLACFVSRPVGYWEVPRFLIQCSCWPDEALLGLGFFRAIVEIRGHAQMACGIIAFEDPKLMFGLS